MQGAIRELQNHLGRTYDVLNATRSGGGRDVANYSKDSELTGVISTPSNPARVQSSSGEELEVEKTIRSVDVAVSDVYEIGHDTHFPTRLQVSISEIGYGDGTYQGSSYGSEVKTYEVLSLDVEDGGTTVLSVREV